MVSCDGDADMGEGLRLRFVLGDDDGGANG